MAAETFDFVALAQQGAAELADLPWGAHAIAGAGLLVGIGLLLTGRKLLRVAIILAAAVGGGAFGFYAPPSFGFSLDPNLTLAVGLAAGAIAGVLLYRATIAVAFMVLLTAIGPLIAAGAMRLSATTAVAQETRAAGETLVQSEFAAPGSLDEAAEAAWERVGAFVSSVRATASSEWDQLEAREKSVLLGSALLGAAAGLFLGSMFHKRVAALMSSALGAAMVLPSAAWLLEAFAPGVGEKLPKQAVTWLALWAGLSVVGAAIQWTSARKQTDS